MFSLFLWWEAAVRVSKVFLISKNNQHVFYLKRFLQIIRIHNLFCGRYISLVCQLGGLSCCFFFGLHSQVFLLSEPSLTVIRGFI